MGYYATLIASGKYKRWKRHQWGYNHGPLYDEPEITPLTGSNIKFNNILRVKVVDDVGAIGHDVYWYIYLYDFIKEGKVIEKTQYIIDEGGKDVKKTVYYDEALDEKLGGEKQKTGGQ